MSDRERIAITQPSQVLAEGKDTVNVLSALADHQGLSVQFHDFGGVQDLRVFLDTFRRSDGFRDIASLGIVRDAESGDADSARQSVLNNLQNAGIDANGTEPAVSTYILPDDQGSGMLETLILRSLSDSPVNDCVREFLQCVERFRPLRRFDKSWINAFIATTDKPNVSVGVAARVGVWNFEHPAFNGLRSFLSALAA